MPKTKNYEYWLWRRKKSTAIIKLYQSWKWSFNVVKDDWSKVSVEEYFGWHKYLIEAALHPFYVIWTDTKDRFDLEIKLSGWWLRWQAEAIKLGLSRALVSFNWEYRLQLKPYWLLKRDSREKERKKYWLKKARKSPQWTKR